MTDLTDARVTDAMLQAGAYAARERGFPMFNAEDARTVYLATLAASPTPPDDVKAEIARIAEAFPPKTKCYSPETLAQYEANTKKAGRQIDKDLTEQKRMASRLRLGLDPTPPDDAKVVRAVARAIVKDKARRRYGQEVADSVNLETEPKYHREEAISAARAALAAASTARDARVRELERLLTDLKPWLESAPAQVQRRVDAALGKDAK